MNTILELEKIVISAVEEAKLRGAIGPTKETLADQSFRVAFPDMTPVFETSFSPK